jgi:hypothetical protein
MEAKVIKLIQKTKHLVQVNGLRLKIGINTAITLRSLPRVNQWHSMIIAILTDNGSISYFINVLKVVIKPYKFTKECTHIRSTFGVF